MTNESSDSYNSNTKILDTKKSEDKEHNFLTHDNFQRLILLQKELFKAFDISPSLRKLVNLLITDENIEKLRQQCQQQYANN